MEKEIKLQLDAAKDLPLVFADVSLVEKVIQNLMDNALISGNLGAGLGLAIVKKILEIHNSTVQVQSRPNQGATFWFQLPTYQAAY